MGLVNALMVYGERRASATLAIHRLDLEAGELTAISAGHPPAVLARPQAAPALVAYASGPPLGWRASYGYRPETLSFPPGSALLLYTDGLIERRGESIDAGLERLAHAAAGPSPVWLPLADRIFNELCFGQPGEDDIAILAVESVGR